mgnify:CR=1 FL=1|tara:strand:+ start:863 stop:970 length:108 start_codon:yes stop_codon:yes gene_type:complete
MPCPIMLKASFNSDESDASEKMSKQIVKLDALAGI